MKYLFTVDLYFISYSAQENTKLAQEAGVKMLVQMLSLRQIPVQANSVATVIRRLAQSNTIPSR